jgi:hypothetical protein
MICLSAKESFSSVSYRRYQLEWGMDSKTIFARTSKGEDEIRSATAHLSGDIKRSLLMVDGKSTFGEINKHAAPSLRSSLEQMFNELIQDGFIQEKGSAGKVSMRAAPSGMVPKMVVPSRKASAPKMSEDGEGDNDLDFASEYRAHSQEALPDEADKAEAEAEAKAHALAQMKVKQNAEARAEAEEKAEVEAQARAKAEAKTRREAEAKSRKDDLAEAPDSIEVQARALQEARELAEAKTRQGSGLNDRAIAEANARLEAEAIAKLEAEAKAKRDAEAKARAAIAAQERALEEARARVEAQAKARREAEARARAEAQAKARREAEARARAEAEAKAGREAVIEANREQELDVAGLKSGNFQASRTTSATVLFFDVIGYTKQPVNKQIEIKKQFNRLVSACLKKLGTSERIILDTGDGAAIGFMQHPEEALKVAMKFRNAVTANQHNDYPELKVRIGIHLGPISVVQDMNGLSNMVGDGINDAQRVMSFAGADQVFISRSYYDFISRLSSEYTSLFHYQGALQDKHGREHPVYKLVDMAVPVTEGELFQAGTDATELKLDTFSFTLPEATESPASTVARSGLGLQKSDVALMNDIGKINQPEETKKSPAAKTSVQSQEQETAPASETVKSDAEEHKPYVNEVKKLEEAQAKVWAEAEQRAKQASKAKAVWDADLPLEPQPVVKTTAPVARAKRKPFPWFKLMAGTVAVVLIVLFVAPFVVPTKEYVPGIEKLLSGKLHQPVYIGRLEGRLLPTPRLDLINMTIGGNKQIKAKLARLDFAIPALFTMVKSIDSLELEGVEVDAAALQQTSELLQQVAADIDFPIARILLKEGKLETEGFKLSGVVGELNFNQAGKFSRAKLHAEGNKYELELESAPLYKTRVSISVHGSALPLLPNWVFDNLTARGEMAGSELVITELDGHIMGGTLLGNARVGWRSGWRAQGSLVAKTITMQNMFKVLSGDMDGTARFQMQAASLAHLADAATLDGSFVIKNGVINGIDIGETARLHRTENMPGGRTHFDELSGELSYDKDAYVFRKLKLSAGVLAAKGTLDYSAQQAAGSITAVLDFREGVGPVSLVLGGTRDNPTLVAR